MGYHTIIKHMKQTDQVEQPIILKTESLKQFIRMLKKTQVHSVIILKENHIVIS